MSLLVVHNSIGKIISVAVVKPGPRPGIGVKLGVTKRQSVLEMQRHGELETKSLVDIHKEYSVDVKAKTLIRRPAKRR